MLFGVGNCCFPSPEPEGTTLVKPQESIMPSTLVNLQDFAARDGAGSREDFLARHPHPFLLLDPRKGRIDGSGVFRHLLPEVLLAGVLAEDVQAVKSEAGIQLVLPVKKIRNRQFPDLITVGRASDSDILIDNPSMSKVHALIRGGPDQVFTLVDSHSTNGTRIDGRVVFSAAPVNLDSGSVVVFGGAFKTIFNTSEDLFDYIGILRQTNKL